MSISFPSSVDMDLSKDQRTAGECLPRICEMISTSSFAPKPVVIVLGGLVMMMGSCARVRYYVGRGGVRLFVGMAD